MTKDSRSTSEFQCDDADSSTWDDVNGAYSPRNDAFRNAQWFFDMWSRLVPGVSPYSKLMIENYCFHIGVVFSCDITNSNVD